MQGPIAAAVVVALVVLLLAPACESGAAPERGATPAVGMADDGIERWPVVVGGVGIRARFARTRAQHFVGLSGVKLGANEGMLFKYGPKIVRNFWMKGCIMGLDIAWLSDDLEVMKIDTLAAPGPSTTDANMPRASSPTEVTYVLELPAGWFKRHGLTAGTRVSLPAGMLRAKAE